MDTLSKHAWLKPSNTNNEYYYTFDVQGGY